MSGFQVGDPIEVLQFGKAKPYVATLKAQGKLNLRGHTFAHADLVGLEPGCRLTSPEGGEFFFVRPTLARWVESMPRFAKTIYPKEAGPILLYADLFPGARVLEAGLGSGGLSLSLLRAIGAEGHLYSYDTREKSLQQGAENVRRWQGQAPSNHSVSEQDVYLDVPDHDLDRIVLDVPEPWQVVPHTERALRRGGILCAFVPSITQTHQFVDALRDSGRFADIHVVETIQRPWQVGRRSVRPENLATPHTGFLSFARHVESRPPRPEPDAAEVGDQGTEPSE